MSTILDDLARDTRVALRVLRRQRGFTAVALLTLALGIGSTTAVFTLVHGILLRPLPYPEPDRIVRLFETDSAQRHMAVSDPNIKDWRARSRSFATFAPYGGSDFTVLGAGEPLRANIQAVGAEFFRTFGARPEVGRAFAPEESRIGGPPVALVSHRFWVHALHGDRDLSSFRLSAWGKTFSVIGVMPASFDFPAGTDLWVPVEPLLDGSSTRTAHNFEVVARLAPGVSLEQAHRAMMTLARQIMAEHPGNDDAVGAAVVPLRDELVGGVRSMLVLFFGAVGLVLLVACLNLAAGGLARAWSRAREMALRAALGAGRTRLVKQLLTEWVLLAVAGGVAGVVLARGLVRATLALGPASLPRASEVSIDLPVLLFALAVSLVTGIAVGLVPALALPLARLRSAIAQGERGSTRGRGVRLGLVAAEVALAVTVVSGALLLARSVRAVLAVDPGFDPRGVLTVDVALPESEYADGARIARYYDAALAQLASIPGVESVGMINAVPLRPSGLGGGFAVADQPGKGGYALYRVVSADYFRMMHIPLLRGRAFGPQDDSSAEHATIVNRTLAERLWPGQDPIGKRIRPYGMDRHATQWLTVVGVVGDVRQQGLSETPRAEHYVYYRQRPERADEATFVLRTRGDPASFGAAARARLVAVDRDVPITSAPMRALVSESIASRRFAMLLVGAFGALALVLAAVGLYGVLAHTVVQRTREIGLRVALGAAPTRVVRLVLAESMRAVTVGVAVGVVGAALLTRLMRGLLYGVSAGDPLTLAAAAGTLVLVAAIAALVPARRAVAVDPVIALRGD